MELYQLRYFLELAKTEHVSATADLLNISQSSLSKSIAALEKELCFPLFDRTKNQLRLNQHGGVFAKYAEQALNTLTFGVNNARNITYEILGNIRICCYAYAPIIVSCANAYSAMNPFINFSISQNSGPLEESQNERVDFIMYSSANGQMKIDKEQFWISHPLLRERKVLIAAKDFDGFPEAREVGKRRIEPADLRNIPFVTMLQRDLFFNDITYEVCQKAGFLPKVFYQTDDFVTKVKIVQSKLAVSLIPESCLKDARLLCPELCAYELVEQDCERTVYLMRHKKAIMSEAALDFWNFALDYFEQPVDERD